MNRFLQSERGNRRGFQTIPGRMGLVPGCSRPQRIHKSAEQKFTKPAKRVTTVIRKNVSRPEKIQEMEAISTLAGGIAHQFNNALFVITANLELLEMKVSQDTQPEKHIEAIKAAAHRMTEMTRQLLDYARGRKYHATVISMIDLVSETLPYFQHACGPSIQLETDLRGDVWKTNADPTQMKAVLLTLLSNASEAMIQGGKIKIACRNEVVSGKKKKSPSRLPPGAYVSLEVKDNGKGMDVEERTRIFEPFFTTKFVGRGLGMAAAYGIVKNHNGWIGVESQTNRGTSVRIHLPAIFDIDKGKAGETGQSTPPYKCTVSSQDTVACRCLG